MKTNQRYLIAIDMDGTLLNKHRKIPFLTLLYLRHLSRKGHVVILSSGRPIRSLMPFYKKLGLKTPMICYNGGYCYHPYKNDFDIVDHSFSKETVRSLFIDLYPRLICNMIIENHDTIIYQNKDDELYRYFPHKNMEVKYQSILDTNMKSYSIIMQMANLDVQNEIKSKVNKNDSIGVRFWSGLKPKYCEIYYKNVSKAECLEHIRKYYHIDKKNIIAIGDSINDIEMINYAEIGVAMKNSCEELLSEADVITEKDNNHNGIPHCLRKLLKRRN